jgi:hypothetical protein
MLQCIEKFLSRFCITEQNIPEISEDPIKKFFDVMCDDLENPNLWNFSVTRHQFNEDVQLWTVRHDKLNIKFKCSYEVYESYWFSFELKQPKILKINIPSNYYNRCSKSLRKMIEDINKENMLKQINSVYDKK